MAPRGTRNRQAPHSPDFQPKVDCGLASACAGRNGRRHRRSTRRRVPPAVPSDSDRRVRRMIAYQSDLVHEGHSVSVSCGSSALTWRVLAEVGAKHSDLGGVNSEPSGPIPPASTDALQIPVVEGTPFADRSACASRGPSATDRRRRYAPGTAVGGSRTWSPVARQPLYAQHRAAQVLPR